MIRPQNSPIWTYKSPMELSKLYQQTKETLAQSGIETPDIDARALICHRAGVEHTDFITNGAFEVPESVVKTIKADIQRRITGEPVSRILGVREFWGLEFIVTPDTLDPRADTETLVEAVLKYVKDRQAPIRILDLGTGTGCIPIALLSELPNATAVAVDYSHAAARVSRENAAKHKMSSRFSVVQGDWMEALKEGVFDVIVSNPPYISPKEIEGLAPEVKNHDPIMALKAEKNGLECYEKIISQLKIHLNEQNRAFLEIGFGQLESLTGLAEESNLRLCDSTADIAGIPRVVEICRGDK